MNILDARNVTANNAEQTRLILEVKTEEDQGYFPIVVSDAANTDFCKSLYENAKNGDYGDIAPFAQYVPTAADLLNDHKAFFDSEKAIALRIEEDYRLELEPITEEELEEVKDYLQLIKPSLLSDSYVEPVRPTIMNVYDTLT